MSKLIFAVGGTGGHLFPAQALARELKNKDPNIEIFFGGGKLRSNRFFEKSEFSFREIASSSPFQTKSLHSLFEMGKGIYQALKLIAAYDPTLVVGFGSFYSFPLLLAARIKKIPYILVNSDVVPGRVNRLFGKRALFTAVQFEEALKIIKGKGELIKMPIWSKSSEKIKLTAQTAREFYELDPNRFTLLAFGGSQGANPINEAVQSLNLSFPYQIIHLCGNEKEQEFKSFYAQKGVHAAVKAFEPNMPIAFSAANLVICRGGAGTLSELIEFGTPAIIVPWPGASENHQYKNGLEMQRMGGGIILEQSKLQDLGKNIEKVKDRELEMRKKIEEYRLQNHPTLSSTILNYLKE